MPKTPRVVAEIGCNHGGDVRLAMRMIAVASEFCEVDAVKFQKRDPRVLLTAEQYAAPHPNPQHAFATTYGAHREFLELTPEEHRELKTEAEKHDVIYSSSVWDVPSARHIISLRPAFIKVPSATNQNFDVLKILCTEYDGDIHISLGMTSRQEEERIVQFVEETGQQHRVVLYACTSGYPVPFEDLALREVERLRRAYGNSVKAIGFSGHHLGIAADIAAMTLGAEWIERHFTLDRTMKGTDHAASLEPDGMRKLVRDVRNVSAALTFKQAEILPIETEQRKKLKWLGR